MKYKITSCRFYKLTGIKLKNSESIRILIVVGRHALVAQGLCVLA
ncbi:hypothetical protein THOE12_70129 [Vibrio rotiferianus]|nr:hypothetical protein THOE12_70129 [Vibrio rotiferianus]